jgi:hypothetical protein
MNGSLVEDYETDPKDFVAKKSRSRRCEELRIGRIEKENRRIRDVGDVTYLELEDEMKEE